MEKSNQGLKVGIFALLALVLAAALILNFSKSAGPWTPQIHVTFESTEVGGLASGAKVMIAGVPVGHVEAVDLGAGGRRVFIRCAILKKFSIHRDALVEIQQSGFLGDQYISITPTLNEGAVLEDGGKMDVVAPFNMIEAARKASGLMQRLDATAAKLDSAITRVDRVLLAEPVLRDLTNAFGNFNRISHRADAAIAEIQGLVASNSPAVGITLSNLNVFTVSLRDTATNISGVVDANKASVQTTLSNLATASDDLKQLSGDLRRGQGVVGALFKDPRMRSQVEGIVQNVGTVSSNLSRFGLLWKPKTFTPLTNDFRYPGRSPFR